MITHISSLYNWLVLLAAAHEMAGSNLFPHRDVHKVTCKSPDQDVSSNCVLIDNRHKSTLADVHHIVESI